MIDVKTLPCDCQQVWTRAIQGKCSPRQAIKAMCQQCMGWEDYLALIRDCGSRDDCPLWHLRPYQGERDSASG